MRPIGLLIALLASAPPALAQTPDFPPDSAIFGPQPPSTTRLLGLDHDSIPPTPIKLACTRYPHFLIKDLSNADEGDQISIAPAGAPCTLQATPGTKNPNLDFPAAPWGAIGDDVFILGVDGLNDGEPFAIINAITGQTLAESAAYPGPAQARLTPVGLTFTFTTQLALPCSLTGPTAALAKSCALAAQKQIGHPIPITLCLTPYRQEQARLNTICDGKDAPGWCATAAANANTDPSVLNAPAQLTLRHGAATITTALPTSCFPSE